MRRALARLPAEVGQFLLALAEPILVAFGVGAGGEALFPFDVERPLAGTVVPAAALQEVGVAIAATALDDPVLARGIGRAGGEGCLDRVR